MPFMEPEITGWMAWRQIETAYGTVSYPGTLFTRAEVARLNHATEDDVTEVEGYGARFSAPGYLDCTEWCVFDTLKEAEEFIAEELAEDELAEDDAE